MPAIVTKHKTTNGRVETVVDWTMDGRQARDLRLGDPMASEEKTLTPMYGEEDPSMEREARWSTLENAGSIGHLNAVGASLLLQTGLEYL